MLILYSSGLMCGSQSHEKYFELDFFFYCFTDETLQILVQIENQLLVPTPTQPSNLQMAKRAISNIANLQDVVKMLENIKRRLLG